MTIKRASIAIAAAGATLAAALAGSLAGPAVALSTPAQARQIHALRAQVARDAKTLKADSKTIAARNKTIAADTVIIGQLNARPPVELSGITTTQQAWSEVNALATSGLFPWNEWNAPICNGTTFSTWTDARSDVSNGVTSGSTTITFQVNTATGYDQSFVPQC